jgi:hypothetical protein
VFWGDVSFPLRTVPVTAKEDLGSFAETMQTTRDSAAFRIGETAKSAIHPTRRRILFAQELRAT